MVELIRRLDRSRFDVHVACFHRRGPLASLVTDEVDIGRDIPAGRFRPPRDGAQRAGVRLVVPPHRRPHRPYLRALREHLRPAGGRAGWRRRARRQPARDSHARQDARTPALPAAGVQGSPRRGRELGCRRGATPPRRRARAQDSHDYERRRLRHVYAGRPDAVAVAASRHHRGQPAERERPRHADRRPSRRSSSRRPDTEFVFVGDGPLREELQEPGDGPRGRRTRDISRRTAVTSRRFWRRATSSFCRLDRRHAQTASSRRWRQDFRSSHPGSAGFRNWS